MIKFMKSFARDERGVTLVEYGIAIALAVALGITALTNLGDDIEGAMDAAGEQMPEATATADPGA